MKQVEEEEAFRHALREFKPHAVFADYRLPSFNGGTALGIARELDPHLPFIMISGALGDEAAVDLLKAGATDFVLKGRLKRLVPALDRAMRDVEKQEALEKARAEVVACNVDLERRVMERTRELREKNEMIEADLRMAQELQVALLPHNFPAIPRNSPPSESAVRIGSVYRCSHVVGGDCYNITRISDTKVCVFICDVMGHGVRAALVTAMLRAIEDQLREKAGDPGLLLSEMNRALCHIFEKSENLVFASACALAIDLDSGAVTISNAGHPCPLLVHHSETNSISPMGRASERGPALGIFPTAQYRNHSSHLVAEDLIFLYTDGLFEVENAESNLFTEEQLREVVSKHADLPPEALVEEVVREVEEFTGGRSFPDDLCAIGIQLMRTVPSAA
jgi:serine phosphatase RsbU (regulator of sigma subunit)